MSSLRVLNRQGDQQLSWDPDAAQRGDPEARAAVREAERIFERERRRGATAFRILPGGIAERIDTLDEGADEIIVLPQMAGG